jgi:hypothetical protein
MFSIFPNGPVLRVHPPALPSLLVVGLVAPPEGYRTLSGGKVQAKQAARHWSKDERR